MLGMGNGELSVKNEEGRVKRFRLSGLAGRIQAVSRGMSRPVGGAGSLSGFIPDDMFVRESSGGMAAIPTDVLTLSEPLRSDWVREMEDQIAAGVMAAWLEGVFWAAPERKLPGALRLRLVGALYHRGVASAEVQRLALELASVRREPEVAVRRASFRFLLTHLRILSPDEVLPVAVAGADPELEPSAGVRHVAQEILRRWVPNLAAARRAVYRLVWQRQEWSAVNRRKLLETILHWLPEADATARERLEGLYLLARAVEDSREETELRIALSRSLLALDWSFLPAAVSDWVREAVHPVCRRLVGSGVDTGTAPFGAWPGGHPVYPAPVAWGVGLLDGAMKRGGSFVKEAALAGG